MNVAFHCYQLSLRGTEVALYDYANNNEDILGNTSYIFTRAGGYQHSSIAEKFQRRFPARVFSYSTIQDLEVLLQANRIDTLYVIKSGGDDGLVSKVCRTAVHAVFQVKQPHGDAYAYVSEWLAGKMSGGSLPFVPHMIDLTGQGSSLRDRYGIPRGAMVYGRYGAPDTFDLDFVHEAIKRTVAARTDIYFLLCDTRKFCDSPRIIHTDPIWEASDKLSFIETCDAMLHARHQGESFGLSIAEFSSQNKPVLTWEGGDELAHLDMLGSKAVLYNEKTIYDIITNFRPDPAVNYDCYTEKFNPKSVMNKFNDVFLKTG